MTGQWRSVPVPSLDGGLNLSRNPLLLQGSESADLLNIDLDENALRNSFGCIKGGNQVAPKPGIRTTVDPGLSPLSIDAGQSVPVRGYGYIPYREDLDLGGDFAASGTFPSETFHARRGKSFNLEISFRIPEDERLYAWETRGSGAPASGAGDSHFENNFGFDEATDECFVIVQKGGDRLAPMSWFLGVANVGGKAPSASQTGFQKITGTDPGSRASNYALVFGWYDAAGWAEQTIDNMRYSLSNPSAGSTGSYSTSSLRAVVVKHFVEPGRTYHVGVQLLLDSAAITAGAWNNDGHLKIAVAEDLAAPTLYTATMVAGVISRSGLYEWKGPSDGLEYLIKYGVRYSSRDAVYLGLGQRMAPWKDLGFIPFGADSAPLEHGGFVMVDRSSTTVASLYPAYQLQASYTGPNTYVNLSHRSMTSGRTDGGGQSPVGVSGASWGGLGTGSGNFNGEAIRGYRLIFTNDAGATFRGGVMTADTYSESGGAGRLSFFGNANNPANFSNIPILVQPFRWRQRPLTLSEFRLYAAVAGSVRDYTDARTRFSLRSEALSDDADDPQIANLLARWPLDDGGEAVLREAVSGWDGYLAPFGLGVSKHGERGANQLFLSGEGEALHLDLSENPVFEREFRNLLNSGAGAFAIEFSGIFPEASYSVDETVSSDYRAMYAPHIATWEIRDPEDDGYATEPQPLLVLTHRSTWATGATTAGVRRPQGFALFVGTGSDQENAGLVRQVGTWDGTNFTWDSNAKWVGKRVTIQFGVESTGVADTFNCYIAATPKSDLKPASGGDAYDSAEFAFYASATVKKKDLARSVITIGGCWDAKRLARGYTEANIRLLLDEVRVYGCAAPGNLPSSSGGTVTTRDGKILGLRSLPARELADADIFLPLGEAVSTVNVTEGSTTVTPAGETVFYGAEPEDTVAAIKETYIAVAGDPFDILEEEGVPRRVPEFYAVSSVAAALDSLTLFTPFGDATRKNAGVRQFRLIGYCSFGDDIRDRPLTLAAGAAFIPASTTIDDAVVSADYFRNPCPVGTDWKFRVYSPLGSASAQAVLPGWVRGLQSPRRNAVLGMQGINDRLMVAASGSLFEHDDRWRNDGPTFSLEKALSFRARRLEPDGLSVGAFDDRLVFSSATNVVIDAAADLNAVTWVYDFWIRPRSVQGYQTIAWVGGTASDPQMNAGDHAINWWLRLRDGRPQLCFGSANTYDGTNRPEKGIFVAEAAYRLVPGEWQHVRFYLISASSGTIISTPKAKVNGKSVTVNLLAKDNGASAGDWLLTAGLSSAGASPVVLVGVGRDSFATAEGNVSFTVDVLKGENVRPTRFAGYMHGADADLADLVVATNSTAFGTSATNFDPFGLDYSTGGYTVKFRAQLQEGSGHKCLDSGASQYGVIHSHPFLSRFHGMGSDDERAAFAVYGRDVFCANGGRVVYERDGEARYAGVVAPTTKPSFDIERDPLWKPNVSAVDPENNADTGTAAAGGNDPIGAATAGDATQFQHYNTLGNNHLKQAWHSEMEWESGDRLSIKCYVRPRGVSGRQLLWSMKDSLQSGASLEIRDGKVGFYFWDTALKKEVGFETGAPVLVPGYVHYLHFRFNWLAQDGAQGNLRPSFWTGGKLRRATISSTTGTFVLGETVNGGVNESGRFLRVYSGSTGSKYIEWIQTGSDEFDSGDTLTGATSGATAVLSAAPTTQVVNDVLTVRRFRQAASSNAWETNTTFDGKTKDTLNIYTTAAPDAVVSFTSQDMVQVTGTTATGLVSDPTAVFTGNATGRVTYTHTGGGAAATGTVFHPDMKGMIWQWGSAAGASFTGVVYRIKTVEAVASPTYVEVVLESTGAVPDFSTISSKAGGVFSGIPLVKVDDDFDNATQPDDADYDIYWMGHPLQATALSGITPFTGETWSFGWYSGTSTDIFWNSATTDDGCLIGSDSFDRELYGSTGTPGPLNFGASAAGQNFTVVDPEQATAAAYTTTQPNEDMEVAMDALASASAKSLFWQSTKSVSLLEGRSRVWVTLYDPRSDLEGNPSPELLVDPSGEDISNPSGDARLLLSEIPTIPGHWRRIYMSLIDGATGFRVAEIPDDTSSSYSILRTQEEIARGQVLRYDQGAPPRCHYLTVHDGRMIYGRIAGQEDGGRFSMVARPHAVPAVNIFVLNTGDNDALTGVWSFKGQLLGFKRNAVVAVQILDGLNNAQATVASGVGCVSHQSIASLDNWLYWIDERGPVTFSGSGVPVYLGSRLEPYFKSTIDPLYLPEISAAINRRRNQYVFTSRRDGERYVRERLALEFDHEMSGAVAGLKRPAMHRLTRYQDPDVTALGEVEPRGGGQRRMVGGTDQGFVVYLDESAVPTRAMLGATAAIHGSTSLTAGAGSTTTKLVLSGSPTMDTDLEGPRGARVRWSSSGNQEAAVLLAESTALHLDRATTATLPSSGASLTLGQLLRIWRSAHFAFGSPEQHKRPYWLSFTRKPQASGTLAFSLYTDLSATAFSFNVARTLDLTLGFEELDIGEAQFIYSTQAGLTTAATDDGIEFEVYGMTWRLMETETR